MATTAQTQQLKNAIVHDSVATCGNEVAGDQPLPRSVLRTGLWLMASAVYDFNGAPGLSCPLGTPNDVIVNTLSQDSGVGRAPDLLDSVSGNLEHTSSGLLGNYVKMLLGASFGWSDDDKFTDGTAICCGRVGAGCSIKLISRRRRRVWQS